MAFLQDWVQRGPSSERIHWALTRSYPRAPRPAQGPFRWFARRGQTAASDHLFFSVRSVVAAGGRHILQYGFADDRGNIVLSVFGQAATPAGDWHCAPPEDLAAEPMEPHALSQLIGAVCRDAALVGFHRVLQGALFPPGAIEGAASVDCAWRRYLRVTRQRDGVGRNEPLGLDDALEAIGIGAVGTPDAALRALGVRELWSWMDAVE